MSTVKMAEAHLVLREGPKAIKGLVKHAQAVELENASLRKENAEFKLEKRATVVAEAMVTKGYLAEEDVPTKVAALMREPGKIEQVKLAVEMANKQDFGVDVADEKPGSGQSDFEAFILGD